MICRIVAKEILESVLSLRFVLSLLLTVSLFVVGSVVFVRRHRAQVRDYWKATNQNLAALSDQSKQLYRLAFYRQEAYVQPTPLTYCAEGFERSLPNCIEFDAFSSDLPEIKGRSNFILPYFSDVDWVFVVSLILSFVALILTYDLLCGEKETGTLRLMLAAGVPRPTVLLGKYLASMVTIGMPLCIGLLLSLIVVMSSKDVILTAGDGGRILGVIFLSLLYLSAFVLLGLFVSSRTARSANSMVVLLLVWVGLVILIPSLGRIISDTAYETPNQLSFQGKLEEASREIWDNAERYGENAGCMSWDVNDPMNNPPARGRLKTAVTNARNQILDAHHARMLAQVSVGRRLTYLSPAVVYRCASEAMAGTGIGHCVKLRRQVKQYQANLLEYIRAEDTKDPKSLHLIFPEKSCAQGWKSISHLPVAFENVPKFQERAATLGTSLKSAIWDIGLLILFNLVFFASSFISFLHYDVR